MLMQAEHKITILKDVGRRFTVAKEIKGKDWNNEDVCKG